MTPGEAARAIAANAQQVIHGKPELVRQAIVALFAGGHVLIEDVPGLGKTTLAQCLARSVDGKLSRIQFTPDLLPAEITGSSVYHQNLEDFRFHQGAVFANFVLADEINRGTPKVQSALLEVMAEGIVTADGSNYAVPSPFMVIATQNPIELEGTYRLPEAQLDRFLMKLSVGYPDRSAEIDVVLSDSAGATAAGLGPVVSLDALTGVIAAVKRLFVHPDVAGYAVDLASATRKHNFANYGASPRGSIALIRAARAWAATDGRDYVTPDDVKNVAHAVLDHRVILSPEAELNHRKSTEVVDEVLRTTPAPAAAR